MGKESRGEYTSRNEALLEEIGQSLKLNKGPEIRSANPMMGSTFKTKFFPLGSYTSSILGQDLYLGLKTVDPRNMTDTRAVQGLAFIRVFYEKFPSLRHELPLVWGVLQASSGEYLGIITEDFTRNNSYPIHELGTSEEEIYREGALPIELKSELENPYLTDWDIARACFMVNGTRRIGDFGGLDRGFAATPEELLRRFPRQDLLDHPERYTIRLDYDITIILELRSVTRSDPQGPTL